MVNKKSNLKLLKEELNCAKNTANEYKTKSDEYLNDLQRLQAEFDNYRKRVASEQTEQIKHANKQLIIDLLEVLDNMNRALNNKKIDIKGIELIFKNISSILNSYGLVPITAKNEKFDPRIHEAITTQESDNESNLILDELEKGYMLNDKVIRASKVIVSKNKENKGEKNE